MITKARIVEIPDPLSNKYKIDIPYFQKAGIEHEHGTITSTVREATLSHEPGNTHGYEVGDVVFIGFEDHRASKPIILGKLYTTKESSGTANYSASTLTIDDVANLPKNTYIGGVKVDSTLFSLANKEPTLISDSAAIEGGSYNITIATSDWATDLDYPNFVSTSFTITKIGNSDFNLSLQAAAVLAAEDVVALSQAMSLIYTGVSENGVVTLYATETPELDLPIHINW